MSAARSTGAAGAGLEPEKKERERWRKPLGKDTGDKAKVGLGSSLTSFSRLFHPPMVASLHYGLVASSWQFDDDAFSSYRRYFADAGSLLQRLLPREMTHSISGTPWMLYSVSIQSPPGFGSSRSSVANPYSDRAA